jgi:hypothetical protein
MRPKNAPRGNPVAVAVAVAVVVVVVVVEAVAVVVVAAGHAAGKPLTGGGAARKVLTTFL